MTIVVTESLVAALFRAPTASIPHRSRGDHQDSPSALASSGCPVFTYRSWVRPQRARQDISYEREPSRHQRRYSRDSRRAHRARRYRRAPHRASLVTKHPRQRLLGQGQSGLARHAGRVHRHRAATGCLSARRGSDTAGRLRGLYGQQSPPGRAGCRRRGVR